MEFRIHLSFLAPSLRSKVKKKFAYLSLLKIKSSFHFFFKNNTTIITQLFCVLGHKYVLGQTQSRCSPSREARVKMSL